MVRTIDVRARRELLADAVWRLMRRGGLEAASVRAVAAEAGLATGSVRHFFATQDELHVFAMRELIRMVTERVDEVTARPPSSFDEGKDEDKGKDDGEEVWTPDRARARVVAILLETLPVSTENHELFAAHLQFMAKSLVHPALRPVAQETADLVHRLNTGLIAFLVESGAARSDLDVDQAATELGALSDGLVFRRLTAPHLLDPDGVRTVVVHCVDRLRGELRGEGDPP